MNAKLCAGPSSGGSARGCVRYILGYELGALAKDENATPEQRRTLFHAQIQESMTRADFGVGAVWQPSTGGGKRPSSIYAKNVTSLATADMEMDALAAIAKSHRVREPVLHFVFSVNPEESKRTTDETLIRAAEHALEKIDLGRNAQVHAVHRDTDHAHVHVSVAAVNADTLRSWERSRNYHRLSRAVREVEIEMNLPHDRGLAMVREGNDGEKRVEWASRSELLAWARERTEERLEEQARKYAMDYLAFEDPQSWATDVVVPRLREYIEEAQTRGEQLRWTDMHLIAAQSAARLGRASETGQLTVQIMERATEGQGERETGKSKLDGFGEPVAPRATKRSMDSYGANLVRQGVARETLRAAQGAVKRCIDFICDPGYDWNDRICALTGARVQQICTRENTLKHHRRCPEGEVGEAFTIEQLATLFAYAMGRIERGYRSGRKGLHTALRDYALLHFFLAAGTRDKETSMTDCADLKPAWSDEVKRYSPYEEVHIRYGKSEPGGPPKQRIVYAAELFKDCWVEIHRYVDEYRPYLVKEGSSDALFLNERGGRLRADSISTIFRQMCDEAGLPEHLHAHCMRHTFATLLRRDDVGLGTISKLLGHAREATTIRYAKLDEALVKDRLVRSQRRRRNEQERSY